MPQPVQLVEFDSAKREFLVDAGQPKAPWKRPRARPSPG